MYKKTKIFQNVYLYNYYENNVLISDYVMYKENILGNFYFKKENDVIEYVLSIKMRKKSEKA